MADEIEKEAVEELTDKAAEVEGGEKEEALDVPSYMLEGAKAAGLDDDTIRDLAQNNAEALQELGMEYLKSKVRQPGQSSGEIEPEEIDFGTPDFVETPNITIPANADANTKALLEALVRQNQTLVQAVNEDRQRLFDFEKSAVVRDTQNQADWDNKIDGYFDGKAKDCPALGTNATLTPSQLEARQTVYAFSRSIKGGSLEDRLEKATKAYMGMTGNAEAALGRKLDKAKTRFSPRPGSQKTQKITEDSSNAAEAEMYKLAKELGIPLGGQP